MSNSFLSNSTDSQDTQNIQDTQEVLNGRDFGNNSFEIYSEKHFDSTYHLEAWSPSADLLALINYNNELHLYRPSWQRHWSVLIKHDSPVVDVMKSATGPAMGGQGNLKPIFPQHQSLPPESTAVSLTWRPDGKMIAVGLINGQVNIYDYSDGSLVHILAGLNPEKKVFSPESQGIYCLKWTDVYLGRQFQTGLLGMQKSQKSILNSLPLFSPIPLSSSQQQMMLTRSMFMKNSNQPGTASGGIKSTQGSGETFEKLEEPDEESIDVMNVLFAGNSCGVFKLQIFGGFDTDPISLLEILESHGVNQVVGKY
ncbi:Anaphase-promoting complex subunit 4 [Entomortierella beljakovae]|nr:Anaphase-promoting complex subunit 4 [Entomortierella beljakovae]